jgi:hypothetical protein
MAPVALDYRGSKGWMIVHQCTRCIKNLPNITAPDDNLAKVGDRSDT